MYKRKLGAYAPIRLCENHIHTVREDYNKPLAVYAINICELQNHY